MEKTTGSKLFRIAVVGPESTGKTTLAEELAEYYKTVSVPEYARGYLNTLKRPYKLQDIEIISKGQLELEDRIATKAKRLLICDTNLIVTKIWAEHAFKKCPDWIKESLKTRIYNLYLLTCPDIPWEPDPQREHPHLREELFSLYLKELSRLNVPYKEVSGLGTQRLKNAVSFIEESLA
jgi:NadR type nicotinamide-nucleotide adenylyltransferase